MVMALFNQKQIICYTVKDENGVTKQFSVFNIYPFFSIAEMLLVYKIVCLNFTSVNAASA